MRDAFKSVRRNDLAEDVHWHVDQDGARLSAFGKMEGLFQDFSHQVSTIYAPSTFYKRAIDLPLGGVCMQVHLLVRMLTIVVGRDIASDHHHRDTVERRVGYTRGAIGQTGRQVAQHDRGLSRYARISVCCVACDLFMAHRYKVDGAFRQSGKDRNVRVAAKPKDMLDLAALQKVNNVLCDCLTC